MALTAEQRRNARIFAQELRRANASPRIAKALFEAGLVESGLRNVNYGDRDSLGILQERSHYGSARRRLNPRLAARRFISEATAANRGFRGTAGQLAQAVQRSQFPDRYDQQGARADALRRRYLNGGGRVPGVARELLSVYGAVPELPAGSRGVADLVGLSERPVVQASAPPEPAFSARASLALPRGYQPPPSGGGAAPRPSITAALNALIQSGELGLTPTMTGGVTNSGSDGSRGQGPSGGVTKLDGKPVEAAIARDLRAARRTGLWKGTVASGVRTRQQQLAAARRFGLQRYGPRGPLGSNHLRGRGAVDVTDPDGLARALRKIGSRLRRGLADDPVHFSRTGR